MQISFLHLKSVVRQLSTISQQLERIADAMEMDLSNQGIHIRIPKADVSGPEPTFEYVDEEMDWARENIPELAKLSRKDDTPVG